jgi:hypothetical protein
MPPMIQYCKITKLVDAIERWNNYGIVLSGGLTNLPNGFAGIKSILTFYLFAIENCTFAPLGVSQKGCQTSLFFNFIKNNRICLTTNLSRI